jgi:hypothetical protein
MAKEKPLHGKVHIRAPFVDKWKTEEEWQAEQQRHKERHERKHKYKDD